MLKKLVDLTNGYVKILLMLWYAVLIYTKSYYIAVGLGDIPTKQINKNLMKILTRKYLQRKGTNIFTFGYPMKKTDIDCFGTMGGAEYFQTNSNHIFQLLPSTFRSDSFIYIGYMYNGVFVKSSIGKGIKLKIY